ncbi:2-aminoethylphosphonate aminotransferase [Chlorogloeopsis sp. ULAP01]|uniref:2-aminoethylphosphonate aminotransferase n=1 Tax=Chlorogloeopsis sp. ULAP01 TaxID=3056483 RepID=UPI0025AAD84D|nr:2-aminoethylphosphonate aminotransferase [Chlorogloeopsis sp. ULAP01]MDM9383709.1 2-aminoethylphosphonate aminotransferase [Chlorogloeopsis sp. ULAP01]
MILLNPGPVNLSDRTRNALLRPDLCHREVEFTELQTTIREKLLKVYELESDRFAAVLLTGSGTAAMEAMIASLVPRNGKLLVIENGVYGERLSKIAKIHGIDYLTLNHSWGTEINLQDLVKLLDDNNDITHLAVVHHETTTGRLNNLAELAPICQERNIQLLVDTVSSFGGEELNFASWGITACAATANKCLHSIPGTSFVIVQREALLSADTAPRTLYLDLATYCREQDQGGTPFTQSVQAFYALAEALSELEEIGGWRARHNYYHELASLVRNGLVAMGIKPLLPPEGSSVVLNAYYLPEGLSYEKFHDELKAQGFVIYAGQGELAKSIFRVSTMGAIAHTDMERFLAVIKHVILT